MAFCLWVSPFHAILDGEPGLDRFRYIRVTSRERRVMTVVSPDQDFLNLCNLVMSAKGFTTVGQICSILSLIILAADIRRVHTEIHTKKPTGVVTIEEEINRLIYDKYQELAKIEDYSNLNNNSEVSRASLHEEIRSILRLSQLNKQLVEGYFIFDTIGSIVSSGKSWRAVYIATLIAVIGICFQVAAIFME